MLLVKMLREARAPSELAEEFDGATQYDWIMYDKDDTKLFCIAIWNTDGKWVLGEYVNITGRDKVIPTKNMGFMTMLEAAISRDKYFYNISSLDFDVKTEVMDNPYWKELLNNKTSGTVSPNSPINLEEFLSEMKRLTKTATIWSNF